MAISAINKIEIIGLQEDKSAVLDLLQESATVELIAAKDDSAGRPALPAQSSTDILKVEEAIHYLTSFQKGEGLLSGMIKLKPMVYQKELQEVLEAFDYKGLLDKLAQLRNRLKTLQQEMDRLLLEKHLLTPWVDLQLPLEQLHQATGHCGIVLGTLPTPDYEHFSEDCRKTGMRLFCDIVHQVRSGTYLVVVYLKEEFEPLEIMLKKHRFNFISLGRHQGTARERLQELTHHLRETDKQIQEIKKEIADLSAEQFKLQVIYDYLFNINYREDTEKRIAAQRWTFYLCGWIRCRDVQKLKERISQRVNKAAVFISPPRPDEDIPTALENKPALEPFEAVTNLYGQPKYNSIDPSGVLALFFVLSFGFCLLDAGYGIILTGLMFFFLKKKNISTPGRNLLRLFFFAGLATIFAGIITGSFFGDLISRLPAQFALVKDIQRKLVLFDPIKDSLVFLGLALVLGSIQIWTGILVKFLVDLRSDKPAAFLLDLPTLFIQTSLLILVMVFLKFLPAYMLNTAAGLFVVSAMIVIYYQWNSNKELSLKIFWSIFGLYSIITGNFLADTLSFSRIFALGMAGGLLAMAMNTMLFPQGYIHNIFDFIKVVLAALILFLSHILNLGISVLGAYVHTSRLQYLEFFSKFFVSGGRPFRPFKKENKYIFLAE
ncbi:MAG: V-type ATP synthase subunit I, partial [Candidatus Omnitrophota bacterium]